MSTLVKRLIYIGLVLNLVGSFLPWRQHGDFFSFWTYGIRIYPSFEDNGGFLIVLVSVILAMSIFRPPDFIKNPIIWSVVLSIALVLVSVFHIVMLLIDRGDVAMVVGAPTVQFGLVMVLIGSTLLLFTTMMLFFRHRNETSQQFQ